MIAIGVGAGWLLIATAVGLTVGRVIRNRDRQVPRLRLVRPQREAAKMARRG